MSRPIKLNFKISDDPVLDASTDFTTDSMSIDYNYDWSFSAVGVGLDGSPTYTIQVSNDNINWYDYNKNSTDVSFVDGVDDIHIAWLYMRIVYTANDNTTGTASMELVLKEGE